MRTMEDLLNLVNTLPIDGKIEFLAIKSELDDGNITPHKATELIDELLDRHTPAIIQ